MLGELEQAILIAILRLGADAHGAAIHREIEAHTRRRLSAAAVYKTLARLEAKEMVTSTIGTPSPTRGGRRKRHYALTILGRQTLAVWLAGIRRLLDGLEVD